MFEIVTFIFTHPVNNMNERGLDSFNSGQGPVAVSYKLEYGLQAS
jgi:hypothetical protein